MLQGEGKTKQKKKNNKKGRWFSVETGEWWRQGESAVKEGCRFLDIDALPQLQGHLSYPPGRLITSDP